MNEIPQFNPNDFEIVKTIGRGSYGNVYLVRNTKTKKQYAAKEQIIKGLKNSFENEIQTYRKTNNAAILPLLGFSPNNFQNKNQTILFTDYMPNGSLDKKIKSIKKSEGTIKYIILLGVALGMKYLHWQGIIHRDLKIANILLDNSMYPKISDFGESKVSDKEFTDILMNKYKGTPLYMAPEIFDGENPYNYKVDVYAFSIFAYELITGKTPYFNREIKTKYQLSKIVKNGERPDISMIEDNNIKNFLKKCWAQKPADRPSFLEIVHEIMNDSFKKFFNITDKKDLEKVNQYLALFDDDLKSPNSKDALDWKKMADEGDIYAIFQYAFMLYNGYGSILNKEEAVKYFKKAADLGFGPAAYNYAFCLRHGIGIEINMQESIRYYKFAAEKGSTDAMLNLGHLFSKGDEIAPNEKEAFKYYSMSAKYGNINGYINMGNMMYLGKGVPQNKKLALQFFKKAADLGSENAMYIYGLILLNESPKDKQDYTEAMKYLKMSADKGNHLSITHLVNEKIFKEGFNQSDPEIKKYIRMAANQDDGNYKDLYNLLGIGEDEPEILKKQADDGNIQAMISYAKMLYSGENVVLNKKEASNYYKKAADLGDFHAMFEIGKMLINGDGIPESKKEGINYLLNSVKNRDVDLMYLYGQLLRKGEGIQMDKIEALRYIKLSADKHYEPAMFAYGQMLINGEGTEINKEKGMTYIMESVVFNKECMYEFGEMLRKGEGIPINKKSAAEWFQKSIKFGHTKSLLSYGIMEYFGEGIPVDKNDGIRLINLAIDRGNVDAMKVIAGIYILKNQKDKTAKYLKMAAEKGDVLSFFLFKYVFRNYYIDIDENEQKLPSFKENNDEIIKVNIYQSFVSQTNNFIFIQNNSVPQNIQKDLINEFQRKYKKFKGILSNLVQQNDPNTLCTIYNFTDCSTKEIDIVLNNVMKRHGIQSHQTCWNIDIFFNEKMLSQKVLDLVLKHSNELIKRNLIWGVDRNIFDGRQIATYFRVNLLNSNAQKLINQSIQNLLLPKKMIFDKIKYPLINDIIINEDMILKNKNDFDFIVNEIKNIEIEPINIERNRLYLYGDYFIRKLFQTFSFICFKNELEKMKALNHINSIIYSNKKNILVYDTNLHYSKLDDSNYTDIVRNNIVKIFQSFKGFKDIQEHVLSIENPIERTYVGFDSLNHLKKAFTKFIHYAHILLFGNNSKIFFKKKNLIYIVVKGNIDSKIEKEIISQYACDIQKNCTEFKGDRFDNLNSKMFNVNFYGFDQLEKYNRAFNLLLQNKRTSNIEFSRFHELKSFMDQVSNVPEEYLFHESL